MKLRIVAAYLLLCVIWGSTWMAIRVLVQYVPAVRAAALRFLIGAALLAVICLARRAPLPASRKQWRAVLVLSITMMALPYGLIFWAEKFVNSSTTAVLYASLPLFVALLTPMVSGTRVPQSVLFSLLVGVGGIALLFEVQLTHSPETIAGGAMVLVSVVSSAFSAIYAKRETSGVDPMVNTAIQLLIGSLPLFLVSWMVERGEAAEWNREAVMALLFLGVFGSAVAFATYYWLLGHMPAYKASTISLVVPFAAIAEGALILREMITPMMFVASVVVLGAVAVVLRAEAEKPLSVVYKAEN